MKKNLYNVLIVLLLLATAYNVFGDGGLTGSAGIDHKELAGLIESEEEFLLLDVRTPEEFRSGHIPTARNIPYDRLPGGLPSAEKDSLVIVYCRSGRRSGIAKQSLEAAGYSNVQDFGGISRWKGELSLTD